MSLKLLKLRWKIYFWTMTGKIKKFQSRLQVTLTQGKPEQILIIFPSEESSFRVAYYTFRDLGKRSNSHNIWKPLHIPIIGFPRFPNSIILSAMFENLAIAPGLK